MDSQPKSILITGASSGIGRALALAYAAPGVRLALCGRSPERLQEIADLCRARGAQISPQRLDVQDRLATKDWVTEIDRKQPLDLVIACAGIASGTGVVGNEEEQTRDIFAVNLAGTLNTVLPLIEPMKLRQSGQIALLSSLAGFRGMPTAPAYAASKAAVRSYGEGLRGRLAGDGIGVSVICPGFVRSRITDTNDFAMPFFMEADKAARIIQTGLRRNKPRIAFPWQAYLLVRIVSALPLAWTDGYLSRGPKKV
ncbi:MAG: SDR family NAD(P)-dependent oxidoreductase [Rhodospirillales bacterium]|nr:SDR family NAD(P)-dependent oxidoreductase [Rhodospirillales bacterium]